MSNHKPSTQVMVEARGDPKEDVVQVEAIAKITKIKKIQRILVMAEVEEIIEEGGAFTEEVDGNSRDKTSRIQPAGNVVKLVTLQMNATVGLTTTIEKMVVDSKEIMHRHLETVKSVSLLCST